MSDLQRAIRMMTYVKQEHIINISERNYTHDDPQYEAVMKKEIEAIDIALSALREKQQREEGCNICKPKRTVLINGIGDLMAIEGNEITVAGKGFPNIGFVIKYCPMCGRTLSKSETVGEDGE